MPLSDCPRHPYHVMSPFRQTVSSLSFDICLSELYFGHRVLELHGHPVANPAAFQQTAAFAAGQRQGRANCRAAAGAQMGDPGAFVQPFSRRTWAHITRSLSHTLIKSTILLLMYVSNTCLMTGCASLHVDLKPCPAGPNSSGCLETSPLPPATCPIQKQMNAKRCT